MLFLKTVAMGVTPKGSTALSLVPKYHLNVGEGSPEGRELSLKVTKQVSEKTSPGLPGLELEGEMFTSPMLTMDNNDFIIVMILSCMTQSILTNVHIEDLINIGISCTG